MIYYFRSKFAPYYFVQQDQITIRLQIEKMQVGIRRIEWDLAHDFNQFRKEQTENIREDKCQYEPIGEEEFRAAFEYVTQMIEVANQ